MKNYQDYQNFSADDYVLDPDFQSWVLQPSPESQQYWTNYLLLYPRKEKEIEQAKIMIRALHGARPMVNADQLEREWRLLGQTIHQYEQSKKFSIKPLLKRYSIAASITLCLLLAGVWWYTEQSTVLSYTTDFEETQNITLPDGSTVILNANSTLSFDKDWHASSPERKVMLEGEAFFTVEKKQLQQGDSSYFSKFIVVTDRLEVEVLGTRFNVNDHVQNTQVSLESGKVLVRNSSGEEIFMDPGEIVELSDNHLLKKAAEVELYTSWKDNKLIFEETPVPEILEMIESRYGYTIELKTNYLNDKRYTGSSPGDEVDLLLYKLSRLYDLSITQKGKKLTISGNKF